MDKRLTREEKMSTVQKRLEDGVREIFTSEKYRRYISAMSRFPRYSINNCILIASQKPDASYVCGFRKWQTDFNRSVNKGEQGIMILAPVKGKAEVEEDVLDESGKALTDKNGERVKEKVIREYQTFKPVYVFDISQTTGDPLPEIVTDLSEKVDSFEKIKEVLVSISPVRVFFEDIRGTAHGYYSAYDKKIVIDAKLPELQMIKTMIHEIAHATLGHGSKDIKLDRETMEVQAESVAYWVSQMMGLDTSDYSFGYISGWSRSKEVPELKESLNVIKQAADKISSSIEEKLKSMNETLIPNSYEEVKKSALYKRSR
jgi:hypothetical protein